MSQSTELLGPPSTEDAESPSDIIRFPSVRRSMAASSRFPSNYLQSRESNGALSTPSNRLSVASMASSTSSASLSFPSNDPSNASTEALLKPPPTSEGKETSNILRFPSARKSLSSIASSSSLDVPYNNESSVSSDLPFRWLTSDEPPNTFRPSTSSASEPGTRQKQFVDTLEEFLPYNKVDPRNSEFRHSNPFISIEDAEANLEEAALHNELELDEYGLRAQPDAAASMKRPGFFKRLFGKKNRAPKPDIDDNKPEGWTWGKVLFFTAILALIFGSGGVFAYFMVVKGE